MPARPANRGLFWSPRGPGATNAVTGMTDALMDSIPIVVLTGQVPTFMIGNDAFQEADTVGITRPCTKHNWLVKDTDDPVGVSCTRRSMWPPRGGPARFWSTSPRTFSLPAPNTRRRKRPSYQTIITAAGQGRSWTRSPNWSRRWKAPSARCSIPAAGYQFRHRRQPALLRELVDATGVPITSTLMGLGRLSRQR